jgi:hypothetical protein
MGFRLGENILTLVEQLKLRNARFWGGVPRGTVAWPEISLFHVEQLLSWFQHKKTPTGGVWRRQSWHRAL